jgi:hypothetical protein
LIDGLARNLRDSLPNASFIGFTGTPIEKTDANTRAVFGDYISIYDIQRAVADKATVPIYYESRVANPWCFPRQAGRIDLGRESLGRSEPDDIRKSAAWNRRIPSNPTNKPELLEAILPCTWPRRSRPTKRAHRYFSFGRRNQFCGSLTRMLSMMGDTTGCITLKLI